MASKCDSKKVRERKRTKNRQNVAKQKFTNGQNLILLSVVVGMKDGHWSLLHISCNNTKSQLFSSKIQNTYKI